MDFNQEDFKTRLYLKLVGYLNAVIGYLNTSLSNYYLRKNIAYADAFLRKFRSREGYSNSAQRKARLKPSCTHLKGGSVKSFYAKDYNVHQHDFSDGTSLIWCGNNCGFKSRPGDANWAEAVKMTTQTSNTRSSSERIFYGKPTVVKPIAVFMDKGIPNGPNPAS